MRLRMVWLLRGNPLKKEIDMFDDTTTEHAVGAGVSFFFGGPIGLALYAGYTAYRFNKKDENGDVKSTDWIGAGFKCGSTGKPFDK